jgi:ATP:ADP antiporter, AAA family
VILQEMAVERGLWETRQLIDQPDDESSPIEAEILRGRTNRSLEHLFNLLTLALPRETVRLAYHGLHTGDRYLRGTALEYLETVLPEPVWAKLWPFLDEGTARSTRPARSSQEAMQELLGSQNSIVLALAEIRRQEEP